MGACETALVMILIGLTFMLLGTMCVVCFYIGYSIYTSDNANQQPDKLKYQEGKIIELERKITSKLNELKE